MTWSKLSNVLNCNREEISFVPLGGTYGQRNCTPLHTWAEESVCCGSSAVLFLTEQPLLGAVWDLTVWQDSCHRHMVCNINNSANARFFNSGPQTQAPSTRAKTIFIPPFSLAAFQEYLCKLNTSSCRNAVLHIQGHCMALVLHQIKKKTRRSMASSWWAIQTNSRGGESSQTF